VSNVQKKKSGEVSKAGIVFKIILLAAMILGLCFIASFILGDAKYKSKSRVGGAHHMNFLEEDYLDKDYGDLYERLSRFELTSEAYALYWEVSEAAVALENLKQWHRAEEKGLDGSAEKKEYYYNEVLSYAQNCKFERNKAELERFAAEARSIFEESCAP
jgi:hypothetical protein